MHGCVPSDGEVLLAPRQVEQRNPTRLPDECAVPLLVASLSVHPLVAPT
jgi:hypothetical protein